MDRISYPQSLSFTIRFQSIPKKQPINHDRNKHISSLPAPPYPSTPSKITITSTDYPLSVVAAPRPTPDPYNSHIQDTSSSSTSCPNSWGTLWPFRWCLCCIPCSVRGVCRRRRKIGSWTGGWIEGLRALVCCGVGRWCCCCCRCSRRCLTSLL